MDRDSIIRHLPTKVSHLCRTALLSGPCLFTSRLIGLISKRYEKRPALQSTYVQRQAVISTQQSCNREDKTPKSRDVVGVMVVNQVGCGLGSNYISSNPISLSCGYLFEEAFSGNRLEFTANYAYWEYDPSVLCLSVCLSQ